MKFTLSLLASAALLSLANCASTTPYASDEALGVVSVSAFAETPSVETTEDAADDPAIWVNPNNPEKSLILATNKQSGIYVYDLSGAQTQYLPVGRVNNVDVRSVQTASGIRHIAAASNRTNNTITLMEIDAATATVKAVGEIPVTEPKIYGYCLGLAEDGSLLSFVNTKTGKVIIHSINLDTFLAKEVATWSLDSQVEGCANDDTAGALFIGEEDVGLWRIKHKKGVEISRELVDTVANDDGLVADVEGVDIWRGKNGTGYVVASAQKADRYVVYNLQAPYEKVGIINIKPNADGSVDGVSHTDGLTISSAYLGPNLPDGLLVTQDDSNTDPAGNQNFKLIDWREVEKALGLKK